MTQRVDELEFENSKQGQKEGYRAPFYDNMPVTAPSKPELTLAQIEAILRVALPREIQRQTILDAQRECTNAIVIPDDDEDSLLPPPSTPRQQTTISPAGNGASTVQNGRQLLSPPSMTGKSSHQPSSSTSGGMHMKPTVPSTPPTKRKSEASEPAGTPQKKSKQSLNPPTPSPSPRYTPIARSQGTPHAVQHSTSNLMAAQSAPGFSQSPQPGFNGAFVGIQLQHNGMQPTRVMPTAFTTPRQPQMVPPRAAADISAQPTRAMPTVVATPQQSHMRQKVSPGAVGDASTQQSRIQSYQQVNSPSTPVMRHSYASQPPPGLSQHQVYNGNLQSTPQHGAQVVRTMPTGAPTPPQQPHMRQYASPRAPATPSQSQVQDLELLALFPELQKQTPNGQIGAQIKSPHQNDQAAIAGSPHQCRNSILPTSQQLGLPKPADAQRGPQMPGGIRRGLQMQGGRQPGSPLPSVRQQCSSMLPVHHQSSPVPPGPQHGSPMPPEQRRGLPMQAGQQCRLPMQQGQQRESPMQSGQQRESTISLGQQHGLLTQRGAPRGPPMAPGQQHSSPIPLQQQRGFQILPEHQGGFQMPPEHQRGFQMLPGPQQIMHNPSAQAQPIQLQNFHNGQMHQARQKHGFKEPPGQQSYLQIPSGQQCGPQFPLGPQQMMQTPPVPVQPMQLHNVHNGQVHQPGQQHGPVMTYPPGQHINTPAILPQSQQQQPKLPTEEMMKANIDREQAQMLQQQREQIQALASQLGLHPSAAPPPPMQRMFEFQRIQRIRLSDRHRGIYSNWQQALIRGHQQGQGFQRQG